MSSAAAKVVAVQRMRWWHVAPAVELERELFGPTAWTAETFWSELARPETRCYSVALDGAGDLLGYAGLMLGSDGQADVQTLAVAARGQGQGLGRHLLNQLIGHAVSAGATALLLEVRADNAAAIALYLSAGFERIAVRRNYYAAGIDAWVMRLRPLTTAAMKEPR